MTQPAQPTVPFDTPHSVAHAAALGTRLRKWADWIALVGLPILCGFIGADSGRDLNWDQLNYHFYIAYAFLGDRLAVDFNAASIQSYINPLPQLPFYWLARSGLDSWLAAFFLAALQGVSLSLLYLAARLATYRMHGYSVVAALSVVSMALAHPVVIAELGSSFAEIVANVPFVAALCALYAGFHRPDGGARAAWWMLAFALAGMAVALKLVYIVFAVGLLMVPLLLSSGWRNRAIRVSAAGAALLGGWYVAGGFWHLRLLESFGNPFFPFFNNIFHSPNYSPIALANDRFSHRGILEIMALPWRMLSLDKFVTTERVVFDPRYAIAVCLAVFALSLRIYRGQRAFNRVTLSGACVVAVWFVGWAISSGNGRYALPMHFAIGLVVAHLCMVASADRFTATASVVGVAIICLISARAFGEQAHWTRAKHADRWLQVNIPESAKVPGALYVSAGYFDRSSSSFLAPWLPQSARFANINGYSNPMPDRPDGRRIAQMIEHHAGEIRLIAEGFPEQFAGKPAALRIWASGINSNLMPYGLRLDDIATCEVVKVNNGSSGDRLKGMASICSLAKVPPLDTRAEKKKIDARFDAIEASLSQKLFPAGTESYFRGDGYCRFYTPLEYYMCESAGRIRVFRIDPREVLLTEPAVRQ